MDNKALFLASVMEETEIPEDFVKSVLTIGKGSSYNVISYGYIYSDNVGNLVPRSAVMLTASPEVITCTRGIGHLELGSFFYKGKQYRSKDNGAELYNEWKTMVGKEIIVFVGPDEMRGGVKDLVSLLQSLFWRLQHDEQRSLTNGGRRKSLRKNCLGRGSQRIFYVRYSCHSSLSRKNPKRNNFCSIDIPTKHRVVGHSLFETTLYSMFNRRKHFYANRCATVQRFCVSQQGLRCSCSGLFWSDIASNATLFKEVAYV